MRLSASICSIVGSSYDGLSSKRPCLNSSIPGGATTCPRSGEIRVLVFDTAVSSITNDGATLQVYDSPKARTTEKQQSQALPTDCLSGEL